MEKIVSRRTQEYKVVNSEQAYLSGKPITIAKIYRRDGDSWIYLATESMKGHFRRESTILKKLGYNK